MKNEKNENEEKGSEAIAKTVTHDLTLSDGRKAFVRAGKGKDAREALRLADGDSGTYMAALVAALTTIDGKGVVMEDLDELPLKDYNLIFGDFTEKNA